MISSTLVLVCLCLFVLVALLLLVLFSLFIWWWARREQAAAPSPAPVQPRPPAPKPEPEPEPEPVVEVVEVVAAELPPEPEVEVVEAVAAELPPEPEHVVEVVEVVAAEPAPEPPPVPVAPDDLKVIEGIGPKIAGLLASVGIVTFAQLAQTDVAQLETILADAGLQHLAKPATWPEQARLAAAGEWDALTQLQDQLKGGRRARA
ncbi:MAG: DUF4332 domain-containing protein [Chloroflexi bacterium]|nr:DUF4332 domain-containing protein [Chloroflexota bacterium]